MIIVSIYSDFWTAALTAYTFILSLPLLGENLKFFSPEYKPSHF